MFQRQIYCSQESAKKYGLSTAILLQALHNLGATKDWKKESIIVASCDWWEPATIKRMVTNLETDGVITTSGSVNERLIRIGGIKKQKKTSVEQASLLPVGKKKKPSKRKPSPIYEMNLVIRQITKSPQTVAESRYFPFSKTLVRAGYTHDQVKTWYSEGGWWYESYWKGQRGYIPKQVDISETIEMARDNKQTEKGKVERKSLWER